MSPGRKHHKKSRSGCDTCKQRRIKCDEARPTCQNCLRRRQQCTYSHPQSLVLNTSNGWSSSETVVGHDPNGLQPGFPNGHQSYLGQQPNTSIQRLSELYLMHHYSTVTFSTLANLNSPEEVDLWRTTIPGEAMKYEFLMDGLLALSSLHLAHLEPTMNQAHIDTAMRYQNSGLCGFRTALNHITDENSSALFAFSILLVLLTLAAPGVCPKETLLAPAESLISMFKLLRGVGILSGMAAQTLCDGTFKILLQPFGGPRVDHEIVCQDGLQTALMQLRKRADYLAKYVGRDKQQLYISSIQSLETSFQQIVAHQSVAIVVAWPVMVNDEIVNLLQQRDPMTQAIWVHYGVLLLHMRSRWWGKDFGIRLINSLSQSIHELDVEWVAFTQMARDCAMAAGQRT